MDISHIELDQLASAHIETLIDNKVSESKSLEFKRDTYGKADSDKKELIKDVSAMANTRGGVIIIGIDEVDGCADSVFAFTGNIDEEALRLNSIIQSSIEPTISGLEIKGIELGVDGHVIAIKVPDSWSAPHRTDFKGTKRFYRRHSSGVYEPDVTELKTMFNASLELEKQFRALRERHSGLVRDDETPVSLLERNQGFLLLQLIPLQSLERLETLNLAENDHNDLNVKLRPLGGSGWNHRYNIDGFVTFRGRNHAYTQLYRNGVIEAAVCAIVRETGENTVRKIIAGSSISEQLLDGTARYLSLLKEMNIQPPIRVYASLLDVKDCRFATYHDQWARDEDEVPNIGKNDVLLPPIDIMNFESKFDVFEAIRPMLDALWNADNRDRCDYYDDDGRWVGHDNVRSLGRRPAQ